jgi:hypothetical protein
MLCSSIWDTQPLRVLGDVVGLLRHLPTTEGPLWDMWEGEWALPEPCGIHFYMFLAPISGITPLFFLLSAVLQLNLGYAAAACIRRCCWVTTSLTYHGGAPVGCLGGRVGAARGSGGSSSRRQAATC